MKNSMKKLGLMAVIGAVSMFAVSGAALASDNDSPLDFGATQVQRADGTMIQVPQYDFRTVDPAPDVAQYDHGSDNDDSRDGNISNGSENVEDFGENA
jgi:hypothetical protein